MSLGEAQTSMQCQTSKYCPVQCFSPVLSPATRAAHASYAAMKSRHFGLQASSRAGLGQTGSSSDLEGGARRERGVGGPGGRSRRNGGALASRPAQGPGHLLGLHYPPHIDRNRRIPPACRPRRARLGASCPLGATGAAGTGRAPAITTRPSAASPPHTRMVRLASAASLWGAGGGATNLGSDLTSPSALGRPRERTAAELQAPRLPPRRSEGAASQSLRRVRRINAAVGLRRLPCGRCRRRVALSIRPSSPPRGSGPLRR